MKKLFDETDTSGMEQVTIDELWDLAYNVAENYFAQWKNIDGQYEIIATELQFQIPMSETLNYTGTIDLVVKDSDGKIWFVDHKTTDNISNYEKRADMDRQISRYWWALQQLGYDVHGFIYNIILKDYPTPPATLKNGSLSQNKAQKTTYDLYLKAIQDNDFNPSGYREMLDHLQAQETPDGNRFFRRLKVYRNQSELDNAMSELDSVTRDMHNARVYRNITKDCSWDCPYQNICVAGMDGSNVDYLIDQLFTKKENV